MKLSIQFYVFLIQISSSSVISPKCKPTTQRPHIFDLNESVVQTETPQQAVDHDRNFVKHGVYPSGLHMEDQFHSSSTEKPSSRIIEKMSPERLTAPSTLTATTVVDKNIHSKSRKRIYEKVFGGFEDGSTPSSSSTGTDESESDQTRTPENSLDSRSSSPEPPIQKIHNSLRSSISRKRIKHPGHLEDQSRLSLLIPHPRIKVNNNGNPPQARDIRDSRLLMDDHAARFDGNRDLSLRIGIDQPNTEERSLPSLSSQHHQIQGDRNSISQAPHPLETEGSMNEEVIQRPDNTPSALNMPEKMAREVNEKEVMSVLLHTGSAASFIKEGLVQKIEAYFDHHKTYSIHRNSPNNLIPYNPEEKESGLMKVQYDVVDGFFGGLFSIFAGHQNIPQYSDLIDDGWTFLGSYLTQAIFYLPGLSRETISRGDSLWEDQWSEQRHLFEYILALKKDENISPHLILNLLKDWEKETIYKPRIYGVVINYDKLLEGCVSLKKNRGNSIWKSRPGVQKDTTNINQNAQQNQMESSQKIHEYTMRSTQKFQSNFTPTQDLQQSHMVPTQFIPKNFMPPSHIPLQDRMRSMTDTLQGNQLSTHVSSDYLTLKHGSLQSNLRTSHDSPQENVGSSHNINQDHTSQTSNFQQNTFSFNRKTPENHVQSNQKTLKKSDDSSTYSKKQAGWIKCQDWTFYDQNCHFTNEVKLFFDGLIKKVTWPPKVPEGATSISIARLIYREKMLFNAIETAGNQITTSFVAALFLIHQTHGIQHPWDHILRSGWGFIKQYFSKWGPWLEKYSTSHTLQILPIAMNSLEISDTEKIIRYLAYHNQRNNSPIFIVWDILSEWYKTEEIFSKFGIMVSNIESIKKVHFQGCPVSETGQGFDGLVQRGRHEVKRSRKRKSPMLVDQEDCTNLHPFQLLAKVNSARLSISPEFVGFLNAIGNKEFQDQEHFYNEYVKEFKDLRVEILKVASENYHGIHSIDQRSSPSQGFSENIDVIKTAVSNVNLKIGPAFIGALNILYKHYHSEDDWNYILQSGLKFLQTYVGQWKDFLESNKSPLCFSDQEQSVLQIDWSNMADVLNYMGKHKSTDFMPIHPLKFLIELWYLSFQSEGSGSIHSAYKITSPNLSIIEEFYLTHLSKIKKSGFVNLWNIENEVGWFSRKNMMMRVILIKQERILGSINGEEGALREDVTGG
ncbi:uncharacterized protein MELLADRAFT_58365 [Melampsora larici-populina 98AG31]|uniref:Secreted protein n=1 Tax=Melampsora larici-populina (strain 98AG31 / pathotype 3-4-7) TaxID=747676 RepID=F4R386_MELLP|nr:uncharacterized protein MELLADRAFT_58365 [Melampsora larici-populina 98AG31]EGG13213.1 hypothetical protein MELLADRAFT_58365 [Melampsora larici-populina 98AG31]